MPSARKILLNAIASFDVDIPQNVCTEALDGIFANDAINENCNDAGDGVTPLMIACDKSITSALNYLRGQIHHYSSTNDSSLVPIFDAWGNVTDKSSESGNCAAHHALAAGFQLGLDVLEYASNKTPLSSEKQDNNLQKYISLLSQPNENGDTPIMMACVYGQSAIIRHILKRSYHLASNTNIVSDSETVVNNTWQSLRELFDRRNEEGYSALNLACGHGHVDIVQLLIHNHCVCMKQGNIMKLKLASNDDSSNESDVIHKLMPLMTVTYDDVLQCQSTVVNLEEGLKIIKQSNLVTKQDAFQQQHRNALECVRMLNNQLDRIATVTANSLLADEGGQNQPHSAKKAKGKSSTKKKKKQHTQQKQHESPHVDSTAIEDTTSADERSRNGWCVRAGSRNLLPLAAASPFITLQDGSVVSKSQKRGNVLWEDGSANQLVHDNSTQKTLQSILQSNSRYDDDAATTMESLCLHPSMLLLSAHGMALEMSPSQLDAIVTILKNQLNASLEAQEIQSRLLKSTKE